MFSLGEKYTVTGDPGRQVRIPPAFKDSIGTETVTDKGEYVEVRIPVSGTYRGLAVSRLYFELAHELSTTWPRLFLTPTPGGQIGSLTEACPRAGNFRRRHPDYGPTWRHPPDGAPSSTARSNSGPVDLRVELPVWAAGRNRRLLPGDLPCGPRSAPRRTSPRDARARRCALCGRVVPGDLRQHPGALHRKPRRARAALASWLRQGLDHGGIRDAAPRDARAHPPRGHPPAVRTDAGDPLHRPLAQGGRQPARGRRAADRGRLRRHPGRRRHAHGVDHRGLGRTARLLRLDAGAPDHLGQPPARARRRDLLRDLPGHPVLDLDYEEDSAAETDANFVITGSGGLVEVQGTAEGKPFTEEFFSVSWSSPRRACRGSSSCRRRP